MVGEKNLPSQGKVSESGKFEILKESQGKLK